MKNIILQHWSGPMNELGNLSKANIEKYAHKLGADYQLLRGDVFRKNLKTPWPPLQKLHMLSEEFDKYNIVVMLDMDMFTRRGMTENIFTDVQGVGRHTGVQKRLLEHMKRQTNITDPTCSYWGGAVYRLEKDIRQRLRKHLKESEIPMFCNRRMHGDEGLMHRLASLAKIKGNYFPDEKWSCGSFEENVGKSCIIHIRTKIAPNGPKRTKMENYRDMVRKGLIEA